MRAIDCAVCVIAAMGRSYGEFSAIGSGQAQPI